MAKRLFSLLLACCLVLALVPAARATDEDFVIENGVLTKYQSSGGDVTILNSVTSTGSYSVFQRSKALL